MFHLAQWLHFVPPPTYVSLRQDQTFFLHLTTVFPIFTIKLGHFMVNAFFQQELKISKIKVCLDYSY